MTDQEPASPPDPPSHVYAIAAWLDRWRLLVLVLSGALTIAGGWLAAHMPVHTDLSYLLPPTAASVKQARALEKRAVVYGTVLIAVESDDPARREQAAQALRRRLEEIDKRLVAGLRFDDAPDRKFGWDNRFLFASLDDLTEARDQLQDKLAKVNPGVIQIADEAKPTDKSGPTLDQRLKDAERDKDHPVEKVSKDGRLQMIILRSPFPSGEVTIGEELVEAVEGAAAAAHRDIGPGAKVSIGITGDIPQAILEHASILHGMLMATLLTVLLVAAGLFWFYRSMLSLGALFWALMVGSIMTFGFTKLAIGHLNLATAFLSSIVIGNGINPGIVLLARHLEERRRGKSGVTAIAAAMAGTWTGTLAASLTASLAYGSLIVTSFRGFRHFGIIGGVGMLLCWCTAYTVLPAGLAVLERRRLKVRTTPPALGTLLERLLPRRLGVVAVVSLALTMVSGVLAWRYLDHPPYEDDFRKLRSNSASLSETKHWSAKFDAAFGMGFSGGFAMAAPTRADATKLADTLTAVDTGKDEAHRLFRWVHSLDELLPKDQEAKLAVLDDIREMLDSKAVQKLEPKDREDALKLRPPDSLRALTDADVPSELAWPFIEKNGTRGRIVLAASGASYNTWVGPELFRFTDAFRKIQLPPGTVVGSTAFVMTDLLRSLERDGPRATLAAILGALLIVLVLVGPGVHGVITILCGVSGTLLLLAIGSVIGLKINFLDFVALPITIGIGIDYSVNVVIRERQEGPGTARHAMTTAGAAVFICSFTTIVGYGTLLLSDNGGIRTFGVAAILGEATCLTTALALAPALLFVLHKRRVPRPGSPQAKDAA